MTTNNEFFLEAKEWSLRKIQIITKYLDGFTRILKKGSYSSLFYIDGFAGRGIYENEIEGSPVQAAKLALEQYPDILQCIFVEKDKDYFGDLQSHTAKFSDFVQTYNGEFSSFADQILQIINKSPSLVFMDAFGIKGMDWQTVCKFASRQHITDIWLRFDHKTIRRLDGFAESESKDARKKLSLLAEHYGISDLQVLHDALNAPTPEERIENAVNLYQIRLERILGQTGFVGSYPIISLDGEKKYHLLFACKNKKAAILASDVVNTVEDDLPIRQAEYADEIRLQRSGQPALFNSIPTSQEIFEQKLITLKEKILEILSNELERDELHFEIINRYRHLFGTFRRKHLTKALRTLVEEKWIKLQGPPSQSGTKIIRIR